MATQAKKETKKEKQDRLNTELKGFNERLVKVEESLKVDKKRLEIAEKILKLKQKSNKVLNGRPEYMTTQEFWDLVREDEDLSFNNIHRPQAEMSLQRAEDDARGLRSAIKSVEKELKENE
ncbi:MAG TPA: hypothetical protein VJ907_03400 [Halanaerobiales bacterium]|nr:hypothetical protein [Halanaerobiales bacterium]